MSQTLKQSKDFDILVQHSIKHSVMPYSAVGLDKSPSPARYARTGWDTCPALIVPLASLALKVLLNATRIYQSLWTITKSVTYSPILKSMQTRQSRCEQIFFGDCFSQKKFDNTGPRSYYKVNKIENFYFLKYPFSRKIQQ